MIDNKKYGDRAFLEGNEKKITHIFSIILDKNHDIFLNKTTTTKKNNLTMLVT